MNPNNTTANANPGANGTISATFTFPEFSNLIQKMFIKKLENTPLDAKPLFIEKTIPNGKGDSIQINELDFTTYASNMPEGTDAIKGNSSVGYHKQVLWYRYALEYDITYKMRTTAQWVDVITETLDALVSAVPQRMNLDMTHIVTFGNATSYVDMDGETRDTSTGDTLALFSAVHTISHPQGAITTYSNIVPGAPTFNKVSLESAQLVGATETIDNFGVLKQMNYDTIWSTTDPTTCNDIKQLLRSVSDPNQANSGVKNPYNMGTRPAFTHLELSKLWTDANGNYNSAKRRWWGIASLGGSNASRWQAYRCIWESPRLIPGGANGGTSLTGTNAEDAHNDNWTFGARGTANQAVVAGRGIIGSLVVS